MVENGTREAPTALRVAVVFSGYTQREIAAAAGIGETYLSKIVNGAPAGHETRQKIAAALGKPEGELWPELAEAA